LDLEGFVDVQDIINYWLGDYQGYMLMRGIEKVAVEISLRILAYNIRRVINMVGLKGKFKSLFTQSDGL